jgi:hypothetical protein
MEIVNQARCTFTLPDKGDFLTADDGISCPAGYRK